MATSAEYVAFVCEQLQDFGEVRARKMFGEYLVYLNEKPLFLVCDQTVFLKKLDCIMEFMASAEVGYPYEGAKEHYVLDLENQALLQAVVPILEAATPLPKRRPNKPKQREKGSK